MHSSLIELEASLSLYNYDQCSLFTNTMIYKAGSPILCQHVLILVPHASLMAVIIVILCADLSQVFTVRYRRPHRLLVIVLLEHKLASTVTTDVIARLIQVDVDLRVTEWPTAITGHHSLATDDHWVLTNEINRKASVHKFLLINKTNPSVVIWLKHLARMSNSFIVFLAGSVGSDSRSNVSRLPQD